MSLRLGVLIFGGLLLTLALLLLTRPAAWGAALYFGVYGLVIVGGVLFERGRYRSLGSRDGGPWEATEERFTDPTTGRLTQVYFNPRTGERRYVPVPKSGSSSGEKS